MGVKGCLLWCLITLYFAPHCLYIVEQKDCSWCLFLQMKEDVFVYHLCYNVFTGRKSVRWNSRNLMKSRIVHSMPNKQSWKNRGNREGWLDVITFISLDSHRYRQVVKETKVVLITNPRRMRETVLEVRAFRWFLWIAAVLSPFKTWRVMLAGSVYWGIGRHE
jgi:hypothetical protein